MIQLIDYYHCFLGKKLNFNAIFLLALMVIPFYGYAASETISDRTIIQMNAYKDIAVIYFSPAYTNSQNCGPQANKAIIRFDSGTANKNEMYALALSAAATGKKVSLGISGCDGSHPNIYRVDVVF